MRWFGPGCSGLGLDKYNVMIADTWHNLTFVDQRWTICDEEVQDVVASGGKIYNLF